MPNPQALSPVFPQHENSQGKERYKLEDATNWGDNKTQEVTDEVKKELGKRGWSQRYFA